MNRSAKVSARWARRMRAADLAAKVSARAADTSSMPNAKPETLSEWARRMGAAIDGADLARDARRAFVACDLARADSASVARMVARGAAFLYPATADGARAPIAPTARPRARKVTR